MHELNCYDGGMAKSRRGRPKMAKGQARGSVVTVRLLKTERKAIGIAAVAAGKRVSDWIREILLSAAIPDKIDSSGVTDKKRKVEESNPLAGEAATPKDVKPC